MIMYSTKEKLHHFNQLRNPLAAHADLELLRQKSPQNSNIERFEFAPQKNFEDILYELLNFATHEEIVLYRREFFATNNDDKSDTGDSGEGNDDIPNPDELNAGNSGEGNDDTSKKKKAKKPSPKKKSSQK